MCTCRERVRRRRGDEERGEGRRERGVEGR